MIQRPVHRVLRGRESGFTLIELITAMLSATILVVTLSSAIVVSVNLLESPPDDQANCEQREIVDRIAKDLRYASSISEDPGNGFQITRPDAVTGANEIVDYELHTEGMRRIVDGGLAMQLDTETPSHQIYIDGNSASAESSSNFVRVRSSSFAATEMAAPNLDIAVPPGTKPSDFMLLCIAAKSPASNPAEVGISPSGWEPIANASIGDIRLLVFGHTYSASWNPTATITRTPSSGIAATMLAIENTSGVNSSATRANFAFSFIPSTHPTPFESPGFSERQLNVQVFVGDNDPWNNGTFGMASFTGVGQVTSSPSSSNNRATVGVLVRSGATPSLNTTPRLLHMTTGRWLQAGIRLGVSP